MINSSTVILLGCKSIGAGLATIALAGVGTGIGIIFGAFLIAVARNPQQKDSMFGFVILGFALTEAVGLFALMIAFTLLYT
jgi:F0F1-type ATP synthase membrane subunit c/vacuolar-type H+-ATPase subunit K